MFILTKWDVLGIIDVQPTFMPGGGLPVNDGDKIVPVINRLLKVFNNAFATQDWHSRDHISLASAWNRRNHNDLKNVLDVIDVAYGKQMLWSDHAIAGTAEAELSPDLDQRNIQAIFRKGFRDDIDSYSGFMENDRKTTTGLDAWLKSRSFKRLFLVGLATDFCVAFTAEDARNLGYEVYIIEDACRGVGIPVDDTNTIELAKRRLREMGVQFLNSSDFGV